MATLVADPERRARLGAAARRAVERRDARTHAAQFVAAVDHTLGRNRDVETRAADGVKEMAVGGR
jgi:hypothetical protein